MILGTNTPGHATAVGGNILNIQGVAGNSAYNNTLTGENAANNWSISGANSGTINGNVTFENFQNLTGGSDNDTFTLNGGSVAKISGGAGTNTVVADNTNNTWNITGSNEGNINAVVAFSNIQNLEGGSANDIFKVSDRGTTSGTVDGNLGYDTIDYSASTNPFSVDLQLLLRLRRVELLVWKMPLFQRYRINRIQLSPQQPDITSGDRPANTPIQQPDATSGDRAANTLLQQLNATPQLQYPSFQYETSPKPQKQPQQVSEKVVLAIASTVDVRLDKLNKLLHAIANFMNSNGGSLSISVDDLLASGGKHGIGFSNNQDLIRQNILARVSASIGAEFTSLVKVRFTTGRDKNMTIVEVSKASKPALLKRD